MRRVKIADDDEVTIEPGDEVADDARGWLLVDASVPLDRRWAPDAWAVWLCADPSCDVGGQPSTVAVAERQFAAHRREVHGDAC